MGRLSCKQRSLSIVLAAVGVLALGLVAQLSADPIIPGKTRFGDETPVVPAEKTQAQAKAATAGDRVSVLVHLQAGADRGPVRGFAAAQGGFVKYEYDILPNVINLRGIPANALAALQATPGVVRWEEDKTVQAHMNDSTPLVRALQSQITAAGFSADGAGVRVCIIDTGIDSNHTMYDARIDTGAGRDFVNNDNDPEDDAGHGAHVAGTAVGRTGLTVNFGCVGSEPFQGMAPEATLIGIKVLNASGSGSFSDVIAGINYGADQTASGGRCDIINMSLGGGQFSGTCDSDSAAAASNNAVDAGVVVVSSSGNDGFNNAMGTPACGSKVIAVGLTFDDDYPNCEFPSQSSFGWCFNPPACTNSCTDVTPSVDEISCMSNKSNALDVTAPGCITFSADKDNSPNGIVGFCGTSMSSPHVAGLAALLLSADPSLTPAEVRQHIRDGAIDLGPAGFDNSYGFGRIDAINSLSLLGPGCTGDPDCDDGLFCNGAETCNAGSCQAGTLVDCSDGVGCTDDSCNEGTDSCDNVANDANCDNGLFCDGSETCDSVSDCQAGTAVDCNDGVGCTDDSCNEGTDSCDNTANDANCDNSVFCDGAETCDPGLDCQAGAAPSCDDGVGCTDDSCNAGTDSCDNIANDANCDNGAFCDGAETCDPALDCQAGSDPCPGQICDESTDTCNDCLVNGDCDDGLFCNGAETCGAGSCQAGTAVNCGDGIGCTDDSCNEGTDSCDNIANNGNCNDGLFCNGSETCDPVLDCQAGTAVDCNDGVGCTDDSCNEGTDSCDNIANDANCPDDGQFCNGDESCDAIADCVSSGDPCTGGDVCNETTDTCDPTACNNDGTCDAGEDCFTCTNDCFSSVGGTCGDGICAGSAEGEDCFTCSADCRCAGGGGCNHCCGDGACTGSENQNNCPVDCDPGFVPPAGSCCGDGTCEGTEDSFNCELDCGPPPVCGDTFCDAGEDECACPADCCGGAPATETACSDGCDNDCDGLTDSADPDCACGQKGDPCAGGGDCCSGNCKRNGTCR